ncbi:unnamed protein product [Durusdinium trenchii]|uniref:EF-hand domain-containing protein n=2 Tax=Durusdinium trenchii TaxID=1381693 RepID=A0ABP0HPA6_9DINO
MRWMKSRSLTQRKMASVVPAGTEVTRQGVSDRIGKRGRVMVVKPIARAYILSEHMMSNMAVGDWLLRKKWPPVVALIIALGLHTADFFGAFYNLSVVPGEHQTPVRIFEPTLESSIMSVVSFLAFGVALLSVLTRVHSQLLWMTLRTFDPWAIIACCARGWAARSFSRYRLRDSGDDVASVHDYFSWGIDLVIVLQFSSLLILAEAADIPKDVMRICVAICLIYCIVLSAGPLIWENMPDWDADAKVQLLFFANMAPKSQFVSAYGTMAVLLTKAAVSTIVQKNAFMYLRCHYEYCMDQLDASFAKLAQSDPSAISYSDFRLALQEMGISESHIFAGFNLLDIEQSGKVSLQNFRKCLMDIFAEYPDASHIVLLGKFCQEAFNQTSGYSSLDSMFGTVFSHWRRFKLEEFGECIYQCLTQDPALASLFRREKMRTQALLFAAFVQVALSWLEEKDFRKVDRDMASLGLRHRSYGVEPEYVCMFQIALLQTVSTILNGLSLQAEISWSVVWSHFVVAPFLAGLVDLDSERPGVYRAVKDILLQAKKEPQFVTMLVRNLHGIVGGYCEWSRLFRDPEHEVQHLAMLLGFLIQVADDLDAGRILKAKQRMRGIAQIHWDRGVVPRHMLAFQHAMSHTFKEVLGPDVFTHSTESSWAVFMQTEVLEVLLLAPFAETQDRVEEWASQMDGQEVDGKAWRALMKLAYVDEPLAEKGLQRVHAENGKSSSLTVNDVIKTFCDESMQHPSWTFEKVVENYCKTPPAAECFLE